MSLWTCTSGARWRRVRAFRETMYSSHTRYSLGRSVRAPTSCLGEAVSTGTTTSPSTWTTQRAARSPAAQACPPRLLRLEIAPVADDERSLAGELKRDRVGRTAADHKTDPSFVEVSLDLGKALQHEGVVACVGLGVSVHQPETDQNRQVSCVRFLNGQLQGRVEARPLRLLQ